ncbi:MAG: rhodanese-like domain-containing protein [Candidatus Hydrogenedentota bacterium]|nr:MAG: rhodanese-like domain-containing protein [Candidatus Hydrogenedentota bacterium]
MFLQPLRRSLTEALILLLAAFPPAAFDLLSLEFSWTPGALSRAMPAETTVVRSGEMSLKEILSSDTPILWVDARREIDYEKEHIPGALLLNEENWNEAAGRFFEAWSPEVLVVVYCNSVSCGRSHHIAKRLKEEAGLDNVVVLAGGWQAWKNR